LEKSSDFAWFGTNYIANNINETSLTFLVCIKSGCSSCRVAECCT